MSQRNTAASPREAGGGTLLIGGITPFSTVDWPGKLACVAFLAGCPWRCPYCQNHALQTFDAAAQDEADLLAFLQKRRGLLDAVVFSGGEPLLQPRTAHVARVVRDMGFEVGLHTCGAFPDLLRQMLPDLCWVGIDVKAPWEKYDSITRSHMRDTGRLVQESLGVLLDAGIPVEARTTWHPDLLAPADIATIGQDLASRGVRHWAVQAYRHIGTDGTLRDETVYAPEVPEGLSDLFETFEFRRA